MDHFRSPVPIGKARISAAVEVNRKNTLGGDLLSSALCLGPIAIGITALTGYVLGNATIAALGTNGKPVAAVTAIVLIAMGAGLFALRWAAAGVFAVRCAAIGVTCIIAADVLSSPFSVHNEGWQLWAARGGVYFHQFPITSILSLGLSAALFFVTTRKNFASHVIASIVLLTNVLFLFAYVLEVPSFLDPSGRLAPVPASTLGLSLISAAVVMARPRGWAVALLSRTSAGMMSRLLLPAALAVPFLALALRNLIADRPWFTPEVGLTVIVAVNVFFGAAIVLGAGATVHKRASESARLASIVDSSDDAIIGQSREGVIESWNSGAERMYGYSAAEAIGRSIAVLAPPGQHDEVPLLLERLRQGERVDSFETVRVARDGRRVEVLLSVSPVVDDTGNIVGASTIAHDITSRKNDKGVIRRLAEQHAVLLATSTDGFWLADLDGLLLDVNDAYCRMSGYSREELLGMTLHDLEAFETPEETSRHIRNIAESGFDRFETKHRTKDNRIIDIEASVSPLGTTGHVLGFARDITLQKQEHEALRSSEERLQLALRAAGLGHFSWDIQTNITTRSEGLLALLGLPPDSFRGTYDSWIERVFPDDLPAVQAETRQALTSGEFCCDFRVVWPDQSIHWLHTRAKVSFSKDGKPLRMVGVNMDITERMRIEKEMRSKTALLEAQLNATTDGILIVDENGRKIVQNPRLIELWKIPRQVAENQDDRQQIEFVKNRTRDPEQFVGKVLYLYSHPNETSHDEVELKDGTILDRYSAPVIGNDGTHFGRVWVFRDITEKKRAEERIEKAMADLEGSNRNLEKGEAALKEAQRAAHVGHWAWSAATGAAVWSDEFYRILGIPVGSVPPSFELYLSLVDPPDRRILEEEMARMVGSGEDGADRDLAIDARITTQTGASRVLAQRVMADRDVSGSVVGFHGTIQDITRRVATEQALRDSEVALAEAQQIAHIGSWIFHPQSGEASVSAETFRIFGIDPRPVVRLKEFLELVHEEDRAAVAARSTASVGTGMLDVEFRIATARGERVVRAVARQRETGDSPFSLIGTIQDITDQKAAEEALRQHSESLQRSNVELDRFNRAAVGRELRMIELKQQINDLYAQSGRPAPYVLPQEHALAGETS